MAHFVDRAVPPGEAAQRQTEGGRRRLAKTRPNGGALPLLHTNGLAVQFRKVPILPLDSRRQVTERLCRRVASAGNTDLQVLVDVRDDRVAVAFKCHEDLLRHSHRSAVTALGRIVDARSCPSLSPSATVCDCMFDAESAPPQASGLMWSLIYGRGDRRNFDFWKIPNLRMVG